MKRELLPTTGSTQSSETDSSSPKKTKKPIKTENTQTTTPKKQKMSTTSTAATPSPGAWTPEKREMLMRKIIGAGVKAFNYEELANELGVTKIQIKNALQDGRKGNMRDKAIKACKGEE